MDNVLHRPRHHAAMVLGGAAICLLTACPLPAPYDVATSAPVVGHLEWADGTPATGIAIILDTDRGANKPCEKPALRTTTDSTGRFALAGLTQHHSVMWVVPNLDLIAPRFLLCMSAHDTVQQMYTGVGSLREKANPDTVSCMLWRWQGNLRATCNGFAGMQIVTGGSWGGPAGDQRDGFYRLLLTAEPTHVKQYKKGYMVDRSYLYVQWVERIAGSDSAHARFKIDSTVNLPIDRDKISTLYQPQLWRREGRWMASAQATARGGFMQGFTRAELIFALGNPGEASLIGGP